MPKFSYTLLYLSILLLFASCNYNAYDSIQRVDVKFKNSLIHKYKGQSSGNSKSEFAIRNRKIEFEYIKKELDTTKQIVIRITSGYNEGELLKKMEISTNNNGIKKINPEELLSREYVEEYSYSKTTPITKQQTITDPGGVDVVIQADGTHKHVHRAPSTKIVNVTENKIDNYNGSKSQIFNEMKLYLNQEEIDAFKDLHSCTLYFQNCQINIKPNKKQLSELKNYL